MFGLESGLGLGREFARVDVIHVERDFLLALAELVVGADDGAVGQAPLLALACGKRRGVAPGQGGGFGDGQLRRPPRGRANQPEGQQHRQQHEAVAEVALELTLSLELCQFLGNLLVDARVENGLMDSELVAALGSKADGVLDQRLDLGKLFGRVAPAFRGRVLLAGLCVRRGGGTLVQDDRNGQVGDLARRLFGTLARLAHLIVAHRRVGIAGLGVLFQPLFADDRGALRVDLFLLDDRSGEVQRGGYAHDGVALAQHLIQHRLSLARQMLLDVALHLELGGRQDEVRFLLVGIGEQVSPRVQEGYLVRGHALDRPGHERGDAHDLRLRQAGAGCQVEYDRRRRRALVLGEGALLGEYQVHPGHLDLIEAGNGAGQLALQRPPQVDLLHEVGHPQRVLVEDLVTERAVGNDALAHQAQAQTVHLVLRHEDGRAAFFELVRDAFLVERLDDAAGFAGLQVAEEQGIGGAAGPVANERQHDDAADQDRGQGQLLPERKTAEELRELIQISVHGQAGDSRASAASDLDAHQFLIRFEHLVAHFGHELERELGLVHGNHHLMHVFLLARDERGDLFVGRLLGGIDALDGFLQGLTEAEAIGAVFMARAGEGAGLLGSLQARGAKALQFGDRHGVPGG